jgi:hypothetical protein
MEDLDHSWRTSSYTGNGGGNCVEVKDTSDAVLVRDTKDRDGLVLAVSADAWRRFTATIELVRHDAARAGTGEFHPCPPPFLDSVRAFDCQAARWDFGVSLGDVDGVADRFHIGWMAWPTGPGRLTRCQWDVARCRHDMDAGRH